MKIRIISKSKPSLCWLNFVVCFPLRFYRSESDVSIIQFNQPVCHVTAQKVSLQVNNTNGAAPAFVSWWHHQNDSCVSNPDWTVQDHRFLFLTSVSGCIFPLSTQCNGWHSSIASESMWHNLLWLLRCSDMVIDRLLSRIPGILMGRKCGLRASDSWLRYWVLLWVWVCVCVLVCHHYYFDKQDLTNKTTKYEELLGV